MSMKKKRHVFSQKILGESAERQRDPSSNQSACITCSVFDEATTRLAEADSWPAPAVLSSAELALLPRRNDASRRPTAVIVGPNRPPCEIDFAVTWCSSTHDYYCMWSRAPRRGDASSFLQRNSQPRRLPPTPSSVLAKKFFERIFFTITKFLPQSMATFFATTTRDLEILFTAFKIYN